ncbi:MAG: cobyric acid synthase [Omnitrophica bacterium]|nr:cobyric acid synthase [Candidatus Omnitrophota bacterium]
MKTAKSLQICGTGSGVGKSIIVAGLCRIFREQGFKVAPFKAQNMALNSAVTPDGLEIGRAQSMQAAACRIEPTCDMNPVLLKPTSNVGSQVIVHGKPVGNMTAVEYYKYKSKIFGKVKQSLYKLLSENDIVVIEGAGSPAEVNLKKHDIVNMKIARLIKSPVLLVGDIDRGGVFAWLLGTLGLLPEVEKRLLKGFIINKFRGDRSLLKGGLDFLEKNSRKKVVGVVPYYTDIKLPEEDSLFFEQAKQKKRVRNKKIKIVVVKIPHISNFTDFDVFEREKCADLEYSIDLKVIEAADCVILPGTKNTCSDLRFLYGKGIAHIIQKKARENHMVVGICGGYQMLGRKIIDAAGIENKGDIDGLGLLNINTFLERKKATFQVEAKDLATGSLIHGYEIHHGQTKKAGTCPSLFLIEKRGTKDVNLRDGAINKRGNVWGTYIHGIFDNFYFRKSFLNKLCARKGVRYKCAKDDFSQENEFDKLANLLKNNLNMEFLERLLQL